MREKCEAIRRARKRAQREGLIRKEDGRDSINSGHLFEAGHVIGDLGRKFDKPAVDARGPANPAADRPDRTGDAGASA